MLDNLQLELRSGEVTAIVGSNGSGKTTLLKLLCRLYDPDQGRILAGGEDIRSFKIDDLRSSVSVLFQDFSRFPATISENIGFGDVERLGERHAIVEAADWASFSEQVEALPEQYDTLLGRWFESGQELSQGQWQRLALARARFRNASIIVLDEPTSSLDALAEEQLLTRLLQLVEGRTTLLISHRFSSVRAADRIAVIESGHVADSWAVMTISSSARVSTLECTRRRPDATLELEEWVCRHPVGARLPGGILRAPSRFSRSRRSVSRRRPAGLRPRARRVL